MSTIPEKDVIKDENPLNTDILDYSPGYGIELGTEVVLEGTRVKVNANTSGGWSPIIDVDVTDRDAVDRLYQKYLDKGVDVWKMMYPGTEYTYDDDTSLEDSSTYTYYSLPEGTPRTNAFKLIKAVQFYEYLNYGEDNNIEYNPYGDNIMATNSAESPDNRVPYNELMSEITPFRVPPASQWNQEVYYNTDGKRVDADGKLIPTFYVDEDLAPVVVPDSVDTYEEKMIYSMALNIYISKHGKDKVPEDLKYLIDEVGETPRWFNITDDDMVKLREHKDILFLNHLIVLPFAPQTLKGSRRLGMKYAGTHAADLMSIEALKRNEYQAVLRTPATPYEWGGAYATGRNVGFVVDGDLWNEQAHSADRYGPLGEIAKPLK